MFPESFGRRNEVKLCKPSNNNLARIDCNNTLQITLYPFERFEVTKWCSSVIWAPPDDVILSYCTVTNIRRLLQHWLEQIKQDKLFFFNLNSAGVDIQGKCCRNRTYVNAKSWAKCLSFFWAILEYLMSMGCLVSYSEGAERMMIAIPDTQATKNNQRKKRSNTIATNFQSSIIYKQYTKYSRQNLVDICNVIAKLMISKLITSNLRCVSFRNPDSFPLFRAQHGILSNTPRA